MIKEPTRYVGDTTTLLDLIFTDSPHLCYQSGVSSPLPNLDYCTIHCSLNISTYKTKAFKRTVWDYKATNINEMNESLNSAPWDTAYALYDDIDEILSYNNNSLIESTCREFFLNKTVTIRTNDKPWMSNEVRYFFRRRDRFFKKFKRTQSTTDKLNFNIARREANTAKRNAIKRYEQKLVNCPKIFWVVSQIGPYLHYMKMVR